jgi:tetratricopeptide (TPR) repeat protein
MGQLYLAKAVQAYERGMQAVAQDRLDQAIPAFEEALALQATYLEAKLALGFTRLQLGELEVALALLEEAVRQSPNHPVALSMLGLALIITEDFPRAQRYLNHATETGEALPPEFAVMIGQMLEMLGDEEGALETLKQAVVEAPDDPEARTALASTLFTMEEWDDAREQIEAALRIDAEWVPALHLQGLLYLAQEHFSEAVAVLTQAQQLAPTHGGTLAALAVALLRTGKREQAIAMAEAAVDLEDLVIDDVLTCAQVYLEVGRLEEAQELLQEVFADDPEDPDAAQLWLETVRQTRDLAALKWFKEEVNPQDPEIRRSIAVCESALLSDTGVRRGARKSADAALAPPAHVYQLKITLIGLRPPIWRRILVSDTMTLAVLHQTIQAAMEWNDSHLHDFTVGGVHYSDPRAGLEETRDERKVTLAGLKLQEKSKLHYLYDFGDSWAHEILVEKVLPFDPAAYYPVAVAGKRAAPPDDSGGVWGFAEMLEALADPTHPQYEEYLDWLGEGYDPEFFDLGVINQRLARGRKG